MQSIAAKFAGSAEAAHKSWGWYLALGLIFIGAGVYAIAYGSAATIASIIALGALLFLAGCTQIAGAFFARGAGHATLFLLAGVLDIVIGGMLIQHPGAGALTVTLLLASLFIFSGALRFVTALWLQFPQYGWVALGSLVSVALGVFLWAQWPVSATWFIGFAVGVNFIIAGIVWSAVAFKLKSI
ncbi:MAG: DUF308 domain-containing protein [Candidatus Eremiobacteraeota bacterium]|nr:DUF308 domain-containing protein [Candidatus Eremiobacteraeota bacterium]